MGSTIPPPQLNDRLSQQHRALMEANRLRRARSLLLGRLGDRGPASSCRMAAEFVWDLPDDLESMPVLPFLKKVRKVGASAAEKLLAAAEVEQLTPLGRLTPRQRAGLAAALRYRAEHVETWGHAT